MHYSTTDMYSPIKHKNFTLALWISLKFDESKAPIKKLDHIKFWSHLSIITPRAHAQQGVK